MQRDQIQNACGNVNFDAASDASTASTVSDASLSDGNDVGSSSSSVGSEVEDFNVYMRTDPVDWTCLEDGDAGRWINLVPFTGKNELFTVNITDD